MTLLTDREWKVKYTPNDGDLVRQFWIPALACGVRYHRTTGYFAAAALAVAMRGVEGLIVNGGTMRMIVGCTLDESEVAAITRGEGLRDAIGNALLKSPFDVPDEAAADALELLAWLIARRHLDVKVAVPCDAERRPVGGTVIFHEKGGVIEDKAGDRLSFTGGINETLQGWRGNWDSFHVHRSWTGEGAHVEAEEETFQRLWADRDGRALVVDIPVAVKERLLTFLPPDDRLPERLQGLDESTKPFDRKERPAETTAAPQPPEPPATDPRRVVWSFLWKAATMPGGGMRVGEATAAVTPWPHQIRAFERMYEPWPPRLLIADEVGLGKTIQAGLLLRQAWLAGRTRRVLVMAPKAVLRQWQLELREKFNLDWPIYDGQRLSWLESAARGTAVRAVGRDEWYQEPAVLVSSHLMRRRDRARELLEQAEPWDLVVLDEAHHARRRGGGIGVSDDRPNQLLRLMHGLRYRTAGLVMLTATPMQVSPMEVWDLLDLLGLPSAWTADAFLAFFDRVRKPAPDAADLAAMAALFRAVEAQYGPVNETDAASRINGGSPLAARKVLRALRDDASTIRLRRLSTEERRGAIAIMLSNTPIRRLVSRHTRELLRRYHKAGQLDTPIADRVVEDRFVDMTEAERTVYERVEDYISTTYNRVPGERRSAVGFVMTIYRRRLASSFHALARTLENRLGRIQGAAAARDDAEEDLIDAEPTGEPVDADDADALEREALALEERGAIADLLDAARRLPADSKAATLSDALEALRADGFPQVIVFTQFVDTMRFIREHLRSVYGDRLICFSGLGGERVSGDGGWQPISREDTKRLFFEGRAEIMICTDAAAEGLNFQFCGAMVNYDMPWNPMRVEQRIGRIDRLGQRFERIRIVNLHLSDTVEADIYLALRTRIGLFERFVGRLQPILSQLPRRIQEATFQGGEERAHARDKAVEGIGAEADALESGGFDLDAVTDAELVIPARPALLYDLADLGALLRCPDLLPPGTAVRPMAGGKDMGLLAPGMAKEVRVTTDPAYYEMHAESVELWSPGSPTFPHPDEFLTEDGVERTAFAAAVGGSGV
ncbi:MAG: helicase [Rhodospirillaceae bacterium]|nr:helicase [Rhodospirillaceae bacterium]